MKFLIVFLKFLVLSFLLLPAVLAVPENYYDLDFLTIQTTIKGSFDVHFTKADSRLERVEANLSFYPLAGDGQTILSQQFDPPPENLLPTVRFVWREPADLESDLKFQATHTVRAERRLPKMTVSIPFPIKSVPAEIMPYLESQRIIDSDPEIVSLARQLTKGQPDLQSAVHAVATWVVQNVEYSLSTANVEASLPASTVLRQRNGVCDELTSLFIALLRAEGIPARFVSGITYTNSPLFDDPWGAHGWAEVYFPGVGWVPYDITYEEFGWLDPTHITAKYTADAGSLSLDYAWWGNGAELSTKELNIDAVVQSTGPKSAPVVGLSISPVHETIGFGSSNRIVATIENSNPFYVTVPLTISKTTQMEVDSAVKQFVLLLPKSTQTVSWLVHIPENLAAGYTYTFPVSVSTISGQTATTSFAAKSDAQIYAPQELPAPEQALPTNAPVLLRCLTPKLEFMPEESPVVQCSIENRQEASQDLQLCIDHQCQSLTVPAMEEQSISFSLPKLSAGIYQYMIRAIAPIAKANAFGTAPMAESPISFSVLDEPKLVIDDINSPLALSFDESAEVRFLVRKRSRADAYNVTAIFGNGFRQEFFVPLFEADREFRVELRGTDLDAGENNLTLRVQWADRNGAVSETAETIPVRLENVTLLQRLLLFLRDIGRGIAGIF